MESRQKTSMKNLAPSHNENAILTGKLASNWTVKESATNIVEEDSHNSSVGPCNPSVAIIKELNHNRLCVLLTNVDRLQDGRDVYCLCSTEGKYQKAYILSFVTRVMQLIIRVLARMKCDILMN